MQADVLLERLARGRGDRVRNPMGFCDGGDNHRRSYTSIVSFMYFALGNPSQPQALCVVGAAIDGAHVD